MPRNNSSASSYSSVNGLDDSTPPFPLYWAAALLLATVFVVALVVFPPVLAEPQAPGSQWQAFLGRFHPIILHLPVGVLILQAMIEVICLRAATEYRWGPVALFTMLIAAAGSVKASLFGLFLARTGGYTDGGTFYMHQMLCLIMTGLVLVALFLRLSAMASGGKSTMLVYRGALGLSIALLSVGAHFGANLVHGSTYLTKYAPQGLADGVKKAEGWILSLAPSSEQPIAPTPAPVPAPVPTTPTPPPAPEPTASGKLVFQDIVLPILEEKCNSCHNADKDKGDLRMHTYELLIKGGSEEGLTVVPGKPDDSLLLQRALLPKDDDEHMPPDDKPDLTAQELALITWWIKEGASPTLKVADAKAPDEIKALLVP
jgi:uncharacterized membrane protein